MATLRKQVRELFAQVLEMDAAQISDTAHFIDELGGDSLQNAFCFPSAWKRSLICSFPQKPLCPAYA